MARRRRLAHASLSALAALTITISTAQAAHGDPHAAGGGHATATTHSTTTHNAAAAPSDMDMHDVLRPVKKYYGVYVSQAPYNMAPVQQVAEETGKAPNLSLWYVDWGADAAKGITDIGTTAPQNACSDGMLPMLTWESWDTAVKASNGSVAVTQPAFAPSAIVAGTYDAYIRATAEVLKQLDCPVALRFDQEMNGDWYPWAVNTPGMSNSAAEYVAMWRHVWDIFEQVGATNVLWVWSPNVQSLTHHGLPDLTADYPGDKYVDWVGVDGYIYDNPNETFHDLFQPTIDQLKTFVADKPWIVAECGVGTGPTKPAQITNILNAVAHRKRFNGVNYFDTDKPYNASDWAIDETSSSLDAFSSAIKNPVYGAAVPGEAPGMRTQGS